MSIEHLKLLRDSLERNKWVVTHELPSDNYRISAKWKISRRNGDSPKTLIFEGLHELDVLPIEQSYGCHIQNNEGLSLYFGKISKSFPSELVSFVETLSNTKD